VNERINISLFPATTYPLIMTAFTLEHVQPGSSVLLIGNAHVKPAELEQLRTQLNNITSEKGQVNFEMLDRLQEGK
jgi:hypothetical protein